MLGDINKDLTPIKYELTLHKPDRSMIANLSEACEIVYETNFGGIDEVKCKIPYYIDKDHRSIKNPNWDLILGDYLVCLNGTEWFVIVEPECKSDSTDFMYLKCFSLEYELSKKMIRKFEGTVKLYDLINPENGILNYIATLTSWSIGNIDADLLLKYRTFDITEQTILECLNELQEKFNCIITYNTALKQINFYKIENIGMNKGLVISEENYIKTIGRQIKHDDIVTRLYVSGKDDLSIRGVNPTGTNFIEDFSYFKNTTYMTQGLINALTAYEALLLSRKSEYEGYLTLLATRQSTLLQKQNELATLQSELKIIQDSIDVAISLGSDLTDLNASKTAKQNQINTKNTEVSTAQAQVDSVLTSIQNLNNILEKSNNFTSQQLVELDFYVREKTWSDSYITDAKELYDEAVVQLKKINQPPVQFEVSIVDFLKIVECQHDWNKLSKGDIINISYGKYNTNIEVRLIGMTHNEDTNDLKLKFSNKSKIDDPYQYLKDIMSMAVSTSTVIDMSKYKWDKSEDNQTQIMQLMNSDLDTAKNKVLSGKDQNVIIDEYGIHLTDKNNDMEQIRMINNVIAFTKNGWQNASLAITPSGIVAEKLYGKVIAGVNLLIQNANSTFVVDGAGVTMSGGAFTITEGNNGIKLDTTNGLTITKSDNKARVLLNATDGFKIQTGNGTGTFPTDVLYFDTSGNANLKGILDATDIKIGGQSILDGVKIKGGIIEGKGLIVKNSSNVTTLQIDSNGNITLGGNITWNSKPSYTASEVGALPQGWSPDMSGYLIKSQTEVFKTLTNNGLWQGLFWHTDEDNVDRLYLNASYIHGNIIDGKFLKTNGNKDNSFKDYILMTDQFIKFINNDELDKPKMEFGFTTSGQYRLPFITLGAGDDSGGNQFIITKGTDNATLTFWSTNGLERYIKFINNGAIAFKGDLDFSQATILGGSLVAKFG